MENILVCTLSPISNSDIFTDFPFSSLTLEVDGKHPFFFGGGRGGGGGGGGGGGP